MSKAFLLGSRGADFFLAAGFLFGAVFFFADFLGMLATWVRAQCFTTENPGLSKLYHYPKTHLRSRGGLRIRRFTDAWACGSSGA